MPASGQSLGFDDALATSVNLSYRRSLRGSAGRRVPKPTFARSYGLRTIPMLGATNRNGLLRTKIARSNSVHFIERPSRRFFLSLDATGRSRRFVRQQTRSDPTLAWKYLSADTGYLGLASNHGIFQSVSSSLHTCCGFPQFERAFGAYLVLMSLHAVNHAPLSRRHRSAILLYVLGTSAFELCT